MRLAIVLLSSIAIGFASIASAPAFERKAGAVRPSKPVVKPATPLTVEECKGLGGELRNAIGVCLSGKACHTVGEDGTPHGVCISAK